MKILFLNGSRGEWGYIRPILRLCEERNIEYGVCATNMVLLPSHGSLINEIKAEGFNVSDEIYMSLEGHNHLSHAKSLGIFLSSFVDSLARFKPDWIVLAGDRGEMMMAAIAGAFTYIPIAHIQAGERSGNIDGMSRHAIGKYAHIHFAANEDAAERLIKLGEEEFRVHNTGAPQLDEMINLDVPSKEYLEEKYSLDLSQPYFMVVQHPVTEEYDLARQHVKTLCAGLKHFDLKKIWIMPNNDAGAHIVKNEIMNNRTSNIHPFSNLTRADYLGFLKHSICMVGNSSSGLLEAPTFKKPAVNLGRRQADRVRGINVIDAPYEVSDIISSIEKAMSVEFQTHMEACENPYGDGKSSGRILDILSNTQIDDKLLIKSLTY
jgi:GDP/UDP-N,N'-diacetylbacillosamine 2-epimerase (hydrolysing)